SGLGLLETYSEERAENAKRLLQTTDRVFDFGASDDPFVAFFRIHIFPYIANFAVGLKSVQNYIFPLVSQIGINYSKASLSEMAGMFDIKAGERMPFFERGGESIYAILKEPKFHLLAFFDGKEDLPDYARDLDRFGSIMDIHKLHLYPQISEIFGTSSSFVVLLRPDNYIGLISEDVSSGKIEEYLTRIFA
ncbi:MAG: pentachlorophenol monooxygenase, partial [Acidobacteria bacterium]|nr:pentachlorophenol monooxygenase [Acidobacteriota bacterium]